MNRQMWLPVLLALVLTMAGCSSSSSDDESTASSGPAETTPVTDGGDEPPATTESGTDTPGTTASAGGGDETDELTATARGVTADTITLGVAITDVNVFAPTGDIAARYQPLVDETNAAGGINGRQVEIVVAEFGVIDATAQDAACLSLTEDTEVFLVLGFLIDGFSNVPCYTDQHDTLVINTTLLQTDDIELSGELLWTTRPDEFASLVDGLELLAPELDGARVAIYSGEGGDRPDIIGELVEGFGAEVVEVTEQQVGGAEDLLAAEAELDVHVERWQAAGIDWLINADGAVAGSLAAMGRAGFTDINIVSPANLVPSNTALDADLSVFPNLVATGPPNQDQLAVDGLYGVPECIDTVNEGTGQGIVAFPPEGEDDQVATTVETCAGWDIFVTLATAAGPDLTPESFLQAGYDLGPFEITGSPSGTVEPGQPFVSDAPAGLFVYDPGTDTFVAR